MIVQHNQNAAVGHRYMALHGGRISTALQKLSSGYRLTKFSDNMVDASRIEAMRFRIAVLERSAQAEEMRAMECRILEGALEEMSSMAGRMVELATYSANGGVDDSDRRMMQQEIDAMAEEVGRIIEGTNTGGSSLEGVLNKLDAYDKRVSGLLAEDEELEIEWNSYSSGSIRAMADNIRVDTQEAAQRAMEGARALVDKVSLARTSLGSMARWSEHMVGSIEDVLDQLNETISILGDVDIATEMVEFVRGQVLQQSAILMSCHALKEPYKILDLLKPLGATAEKKTSL